MNSRCNTAKLLWVVIYVVCYGRFSPDLVVMNICRQRLIKVKSPLWQRSLANENAVVCRQGAMRWRLGQRLFVFSNVDSNKFVDLIKLAKEQCGIDFDLKEKQLKCMEMVVDLKDRTVLEFFLQDTLYFPHCWTTTNVNKCSTTRSTDSSIVVLVVSPLQALLEEHLEQVKIRT